MCPSMDDTLVSLCREVERREDLCNVGVDISGFPMIVAVTTETPSSC